MKNIDREIANITAQKKWSIPDKAWTVIEVELKKEDNLDSEIEDMEDRLSILKSERKISHRNLWKTIHKEMPGLPEDINYSLELKERQLVERSGSSLPPFLQNLVEGIKSGKISRGGGMAINPETGEISDVESFGEDDDESEKE